MSASCAVVSGIGGWNLRVDTSSCPDSAPVNCGTGLQVRCCPSGYTCAGGSSNICCPQGSNCADSIYNAALCADPSWNLWQKPGNISSSNGAWCCQSSYTGLYTSGGVMCLAAGSVPSSASVAIQTAQTSTCSTSSSRTSSRASVTSSSTAVVVTSSASSSSNPSSKNTATRTSTSAAQTKTNSSYYNTSGTSSSSVSKIGIGVGVALGLLLIILGIAAFFLRRRRRNRELADDSGVTQPWLSETQPTKTGPALYKDNENIVVDDRDKKTGTRVELYGDAVQRHELEVNPHVTTWGPPGRAELE